MPKHKAKKKKSFPDLSGDGKTTMKDILIGRGVIKRSKGGSTMPGMKKRMKQKEEWKKGEEWKKKKRGMIKEKKSGMKK